jgi:hypothetical protein
MTTSAHMNLSPSSKLADSAGFKSHPMRGSIRREHLLRREDNDPARERRIMIRDMLISVMGGISALVPMFVAVQSVMGA